MSKCLAEQRLAHRRALDVPARPAGAVGARPLGVFGLARLRRLPQHEVERVLLAVEHGDALAGAQLVDRLARELAVAGELAHREVHVAARACDSRGPCASSVAIISSICGTYSVARGSCVGGSMPSAVGILVQGGDHLLGERPDRDAALERALDDLVVDVGDVAHVGDAIAERLQPALHHVERHHEPRVAHVAEVVDRDAADVQADVARLDRHEGLGRPRQRVMDAKCHGPKAPPGRVAEGQSPGRPALQSNQYSGPFCTICRLSRPANPGAGRPAFDDASPSARRLHPPRRSPWPWRLPARCAAALAEELAR